MTDAARWNLQHGIPENKAFEHTDYTAESALDNWILAKMNNRRIILDARNYDNMMRATEEEVKKVAAAAIDDLLKPFK